MLIDRTNLNFSHHFISYFKIGSKCVQFNFYNKLAVDDARKECEKHHKQGTLVSIHSDKEQGKGNRNLFRYQYFTSFNLFTFQ